MAEFTDDGLHVDTVNTMISGLREYAEDLKVCLGVPDEEGRFYFQVKLWTVQLLRKSWEKRIQTVVSKGTEELEPGKDHRGRHWVAERCKAPDCRGKRVTIPFVVSDYVWQRVIQGRWNIVCLSCFDEMAQDQGVDYEADILGALKFVRVGSDFYYEGRGV